jgi:hypothetical protein
MKLIRKSVLQSSGVAVRQYLNDKFKKDKLDKI